MMQMKAEYQLLYLFNFLLHEAYNYVYKDFENIKTRWTYILTAGS